MFSRRQAAATWLFFVALAPTSISGLSGISPTTTKAASSSSPSSSFVTNTPQVNPLQDFDHYTQDRLPWSPDGYMTWNWQGHDINYLEMGDPTKPALLLIHGFGASAYHWRYNVPVLARDYHVYAMDLLGFGLSDKPLLDYEAHVWRDQTQAFCQDVIQKPTTLAGNSLGGFTALYTASTAGPELIPGCVLLNGAGRFQDPTAPDTTPSSDPNPLVTSVQTWLQKLVIGASFWYTKQPARIEQVLRQVYPVNADMVDEELVESIRQPSLDPNAAEVFYRVISTNSQGPPSVTIDDLLAKLKAPLLLCWGEEDPWIRSAAADKIQALYPRAQRVSIDAGHCPHDEAAPAVNAALLDFMKTLSSSSSSSSSSS